MPRTSLQDVRSLPDPLLTYNWDLIIPSMPGTPQQSGVHIQGNDHQHSWCTY